jgi:hypothetical protein
LVSSSANLSGIAAALGLASKVSSRLSALAALAEVRTKFHSFLSPVFSSGKR